jgi:predicted kinase
MPLLIIITGAPATGKTRIGHHLAAELHLPYLSKDDIKERLFDTLGIGDRLWSQRLGSATFELLYYVLDLMMSAGQSTIVDCNFPSEPSTTRLLALKRTYGFETFQIVCQADPEVLLARYRARWDAGERHPGHVDPEVVEHFERVGMGTYAVLAIGGDSVTIDTTDLATVDVAPITARLRQTLQGS